ncbi:potassium transporter 5 [Quercus suber]|uniref:Potassium transporter 5 n=1 Tax=Quercus suber TaxID=58331 RepID=A0AAW0LID4_QUESU
MSSLSHKFVDGGYLPLLFASTLVTIMYLWNYGYWKKYKYELDNKVSTHKLVEVASDPSIHRVPSVALFYTDLVYGIFPVFTYYVANVFIRNDVLKPNELADNNEVEKVDEEMVQREMGIIDDAPKFGDVVYLIGVNEVMASKGSSFLKKLAINYAYNRLKRCVSRQMKFS